MTYSSGAANKLKDHMSKLIINLNFIYITLFMSFPVFANQNVNNFVKMAKQNLTNNFLDPDSAKFRNLEVKEWIGAENKKNLSLCGEVNSKNLYGAYTGFKVFNATVLGASIVDNKKSGFMDIEVFFHETYCGSEAILIKKIDK